MYHLVNDHRMDSELVDIPGSKWWTIELNRAATDTPPIILGPSGLPSNMNPNSKNSSVPRSRTSLDQYSQMNDHLRHQMAGMALNSYGTLSPTQSKKRKSEPDYRGLDGIDKAARLTGLSFFISYATCGLLFTAFFPALAALRKAGRSSA